MNENPNRKPTKPSVFERTMREIFGSYADEFTEHLRKALVSKAELTLFEAQRTRCVIQKELLLAKTKLLILRAKQIEPDFSTVCIPKFKLWEIHDALMNAAKAISPDLVKDPKTADLEGVRSQLFFQGSFIWHFLSSIRREG